MKKLALITTAGALAAFMSATGPAVAQEEEPDPHALCVEAFNEAWGAPGENVKDPEVGFEDESASENAQRRNELRKAECDPLKGEEDSLPD